MDCLICHNKLKIKGMNKQDRIKILKKCNLENHKKMDHAVDTEIFWRVDFDPEFLKYQNKKILNRPFVHLFERKWNNTHECYVEDDKIIRYGTLLSFIYVEKLKKIISAAKEDNDELELTSDSIQALNFHLPKLKRVINKIANINIQYVKIYKTKHYDVLNYPVAILILDNNVQLGIKSIRKKRFRLQANAGGLLCLNSGNLSNTNLELRKNTLFTVITFY